MKKSIRFIYFDVGGVLLDWRAGHRRVSEKYRVPYDVIRNIFDANWQDACKGKLSNEAYMAKFAEVLAIPKPYPDVSDFWTDYHMPIHETHAFVHELIAMYKVGLLTNAEKYAMKHASQKRLIPDVVWSAIVDSSEHGTIKPEARIFEIAESLAGVSPKEIFFIDDVQAHIEAACSRGWQGIVFDTNKPTKSIKQITSYLQG